MDPCCLISINRWWRKAYLLSVYQYFLMEQITNYYYVDISETAYRMALYKFVLIDWLIDWLIMMLHNVVDEILTWIEVNFVHCRILDEIINVVQKYTTAYYVVLDFGGGMRSNECPSSYYYYYYEHCIQQNQNCITGEKGQRTLFV